MAAQPTTVESSAAKTVPAKLVLTSSEWELSASVNVPAGPSGWRQMLPLVQSLTDAMVDAAAKTVEAQGQSISCRKGCGACCRQLVPVAEPEARHLRELIERMPEARRTEVRSRFAAASHRLEERGLLSRLRQSTEWTKSSFLALATEYFGLGLACPFLEEEACSIHADRPLKCREFLVTTPAVNCARPTPENVRSVPLPVSLAAALARQDVSATSRCFERWVPLILAPEWAEGHPDQTSPRPGSQLLGELLAELKAPEGARDKT